MFISRSANGVTQSMHIGNSEGPLLPIDSNQTRRITSRNSTPYGLDASGRQVPLSHTLPSECGMLFDQYVLRVLPEYPYKHLMPSGREINNLWPNRKLRILPLKPKNTNLNPQWKEGVVVKWNQTNSGPFCPVTLWSVTIRLIRDDDVDESKNNSFRLGDLVTIRDLKNATHHNGKEATVIKYAKEDHRYGVTYRTNSGSSSSSSQQISIAVKPENISPILEIERKVCRLNIENGGTLHGQTSDCDVSDLISFEWMDPAEPDPKEVDFSTSFAPCPMCRKIQGPRYNIQTEEESEEEEECPICLESKICPKLDCSHVVCQECWKNWKDTSGGRTSTKLLEPISSFFDNSDEVRQKREENLVHYSNNIDVSWMGAPDVDEDTHEFIQTERRNNWDAFVKEFWSQLVESVDEESNISALANFREQLLVWPGNVWLNQHTIPNFNDLPINALDVLVDVLQFKNERGFIMEELRMTEEREGRKASVQTDENGITHPFDLNKRVAGWKDEAMLTIGHKYEAVHNFRDQIKWYEKSLDCAMVSNYKYEHTSTAMLNLGVAFMYAGYLNKSSECFNASADIYEPRDGRPFLQKSRSRLINEMKHWMGTIGKMPSDDYYSMSVKIPYVLEQLRNEYLEELSRDSDDFDGPESID